MNVSSLLPLQETKETVAVRALSPPSPTSLRVSLRVSIKPSWVQRIGVGDIFLLQFQAATGWVWVSRGVRPWQPHDRSLREWATNAGVNSFDFLEKFSILSGLKF